MSFFWQQEFRKYSLEYSVEFLKNILSDFCGHSYIIGKLCCFLYTILICCVKLKTLYIILQTTEVEMTYSLNPVSLLDWPNAANFGNGVETTTGCIGPCSSYVSSKGRGTGLVGHCRITSTHTITCIRGGHNFGVKIENSDTRVSAFLLC